MAATKRNAMWIEETREKVRASQLINRLLNHGLGTLELSMSQIKAIDILLRKTIPDLQAVTIEGSKENPLEVHHTEAREYLARNVLGLKARIGDTVDPERPDGSTVN